MLSFDWNAAKAKLNERKHGISFHEARSVFYDENALQFYDNVHSNGDERFLMLGLSHMFRLLVVVHCESENGETIRIISARKATAREARYYISSNR
jgi:uncharacterized DUF497 family protein